jgi:DNA repair ATPase RecN
MNKYYYKQSLGAKNERIAILETTQVDNYLSKMESEKSYRNQIIKEYEKKIEELVADINAKEVLMAELKTMSDNLETLAASGWAYTHPWEGEFLKKELGEGRRGKEKLGE